MSSYDPDEAARALLNAMSAVLGSQGKFMPTVDDAVRRVVSGRLRAAYQAGQREAVRPPAQTISRGQRERLTGRQQDALDFVVDFTTDNGFPPTLREIGDHMGIRSTNGVNDHLKALERKGYIERKELQSRGIRVVGLETHQQLRERCAQMEAELEELCGGSVVTIPILRGLGRSVDAPRRE
jgi:DNA-binding MarR family transcriptional regulator